MSYEDKKQREELARQLKQYIGDFYEAHAADDVPKRDAALKKIQTALFTGNSDSEPFREYFNEIFSGRTAFNTMLSIGDYPKESILRELFQNTFGCHYETKDIKVLMNFQTNQHQVSISYNEVGFTMEQILYYLSFGRGERDKTGTREGRFGVGAKSVFLNVEWLALKSNNFSFKIQNDRGTLKILELSLFESQQYLGTEITFKVRGDEFAAIMDNFLTLGDKKGDYMSLMELCFAFNRKKIMDTRTGGREEAKDRTINLAIKVNNEPKTVYKIMQYQKPGEEYPTIRFMQNGKSMIDFLCYENAGFSYLVPCAVANTKRAELVKLLRQKYNYFSTYELTGLYKEDNEAFLDERLSAFFISVPNDYITPHRTGIRFNAEKEVKDRIRGDLTEMIKVYRHYFVLTMQPAPKTTDRFFLFPRSYAFEFFNHYINTSKFGGSLGTHFQNHLSLIYPGETTPVEYEELKKTGFQTVAENVPAERHKDGTARTEYIDNAMDSLREQVGDIGDRTLYAAYIWEEQGGKGGREYLYEFSRGGKTYYIDSKATPNRSDNSFYSGFGTAAAKVAQTILKDNIISNETDLEGLFAMYDDIYHEDYKVVLKYGQLYISHGDEQQHYEATKMQIANINDAMTTIQKRQHRFDTHQTYNDVVSMLINTFNQGKDTMEMLRQIKAQGGQITLQLDINKRYRFAAYNKQFMIPPSVSNADMLDLVGDVGTLIKCGMLDKRVFDFPYSKNRYLFDKKMLSGMFAGDSLTEEEIASRASKLYVSDLKTDRVALIDGEGKIIKIIEIGEEIKPEWRESTQKYIALRADYTKPEFADVAEYVITGENHSKLSRHYLTAESPNLVIADQMPCYLRALPTITKEEFAYLRAQCRKIAQHRESRSYLNYFAKDVNAKLFGYGGSCCACGFESRAINSFSMKDFEVEVLTEDSELPFKFSLYLCANDAAAAGGWLITGISVGGMSPVRWLQEIKKAETIPPEFLFCSIKYRTQVTYDILGTDSTAAGETSFDGGREELEITLSPLMAAKWVEDNPIELPDEDGK